MADDAAQRADGEPGGSARFQAGPGDRYVVHVEGEVDAGSENELRDLLESAFDASPDVVVVDLAGLTFIDSVGLGVLVTAHNRGEADGIGFQVHGLPADCRRVFEITNLVEVLDLR